ncbi:MAG: membrane protein [Gemmatimonadota bacterium]|nr:MAG: membrane protein [Gemmatimonadota bacterium]
MNALRRYFLTGIVAILPVGVTVWVLVRLFVAVDGTVSPWLAHWVGFEIPGFGFLVTILFVLLIGIFASNFIGRTVISRFERLFGRLPLVSKIYNAVKQIGDGILGSQKNLFEEAVMFEYPRRGCWAIGFVTSRHEGFVVEYTGKPHLHVFVPTTPNPTSGFLLFLPEDDIIPLDISVEDGLKLVISGGAVSPPGGGRLSPKIADRSVSGNQVVPES